MISKNMMWAFLFFVLLGPDDAVAGRIIEIDYQCLKLCMAQKGVYHICKSYCSIGEESQKQAGYFLLKTPIPVYGKNIKEKKKVLQIKRQTNYMCIRECLKSKSQYTFCQQRCQRD